MRPRQIAYGAFWVPLAFQLGERAAAELHVWRARVAWDVMRGWYDDLLDVV